MVICAETRAPEILATLAADGAELLAMPTCWVNGSRTPGQFANPQVDFLIEARAREFGLPFVCADKSGLELAGVGMSGKSRIVAADGSLVAEAPATGETVIIARIEPAAIYLAALRLRGHRPAGEQGDPPVRPESDRSGAFQVDRDPRDRPRRRCSMPTGRLLHHFREHTADLLIAPDGRRRCRPAIARPRRRSGYPTADLRRRRAKSSSSAEAASPA